MDQNQQSRRGQYNRGRRGPDRRGPDRRTPPPQTQAQAHGGRDHVDVEQIMRDIRSRIGQRQGIDLSDQQIQELAARRLEAILDPRALKPGLLDELRRSAGSPPPKAEPAATPGLAYTFEDTTLYESHRAVLRFFRRILNPLLKLFFNPDPLIQALNIQGRWNAAAMQREAEHERRQTEWNGLHYELVHRMVTEVSRLSLEVHGLSAQVESLSAKVDFNERRVRGMEGTVHQTRPSPPPRQTEPAAATVVSSGASLDAPATDAPGEGQSPDGTKRRRRRRRGRRGTGAPGEGMPGSPQQSEQQGSGASGGGEDEGPDDEQEQGMDEPAVIAAAQPSQEFGAPHEPAPAVSHNSPRELPPPPPAPETREPEE